MKKTLTLLLAIMLLSACDKGYKEYKTSETEAKKAITTEEPPISEETSTAKETVTENTPITEEIDNEQIPVIAITSDAVINGVDLSPLALLNAFINEYGHIIIFGGNNANFHSGVIDEYGRAIPDLKWVVPYADNLDEYYVPGIEFDKVHSAFEKYFPGLINEKDYCYFLLNDDAVIETVVCLKITDNFDYVFWTSEENSTVVYCAPMYNLDDNGVRGFIILKDALESGEFKIDVIKSEELGSYKDVNASSIERFLAGEPTPVENDNSDYPISFEEAVDLVYNKLSEKNKLIENAQFSCIALVKYNGIDYCHVEEYVFFEDFAHRTQSYFVNAVTGEVYLDYDPTLYRLSAGERFPEFVDIIEEIGDDGRTWLIKIE